MSNAGEHPAKGSELTLTDFLLARIAEDEAVAQAASISAHEGYKPHPDLKSWQYSPWTPSCSGEVEYEQTPEMLAHKYAERIYVTCDGEGLSPSVGEDVGPHIARHDPARVLAECEAKRQIVEMHPMDGAILPLDPDGDDIPCCSECETYRGTADEGARDWPCGTLRALATVYADHPDYRDDWRP